MKIMDSINMQDIENNFVLIQHRKKIEHSS